MISDPAPFIKNFLKKIEFFRVQESFKLVKEQRDELIMRSRDSIDSPNTLTVNEEIRELKTEMKRQKAVYEAQFIEYVSRNSI